MLPARFPLPAHTHMQFVMMPPSYGALTHSCSLTPLRDYPHKSLACSWPYAMEASACAVRSVVRQRPFGHPGPTTSQPCSDATALSPFDLCRT